MMTSINKNTPPSNSNVLNLFRLITLPLHDIFTGNVIFFVDKAMDTHLMNLAKRIPENWDILAKYLGVSDHKIKAIELNYPSSVERRAYMMLKHWWRSRDEAAQCWREELSKALCEIKRNDLARDFTAE